MGSPMPRDLTEEAVARMLRAAWIADEPIPAAGSFDEIGPLMRKAWMATARAVLALVERCCVRAVIDYDPMANGDPKLDDVVARVMGKDGAKRGSDTGEARGEVKRG